MSLEQARACRAKIECDAAFAERVMAFETLQERFAFLKQEGFECTAEEMQEVSTELSDDDLDAATGGFGLSNIAHSVGKVGGTIFKGVGKVEHSLGTATHALGSAAKNL